MRIVSCTAAMTLTLGLTVPNGAHAMNLVRVETRTDQAVAKYGVTGRGVTVAVLDRGIDWKQPDFIKPDGNTRIKWLLDMSGQNGCPGSPAPVEYSEAQINAALHGGPGINTRDAVGHGTATAGTAAGNGRAFASAKYRGIAPEVDLIIVKLTSEGAPAHGTQPAEIGFQGCTDEALNWLDAKITLLGQPCVAIINSGTQWGPIDGTSAVSRKIDSVFGPDRPGRIMVLPAGDEGSLPNHAGTDYDDTTDSVIRLTKINTQLVYMSMWYTGSHPAQVTITFDDGTSVGPVGPNSSLDQNGIAVYQYNAGTQFYPWTSTSSDSAVWIRITGHSGGGSLRIRGTAPGTGHMDAYSDVWGPNLTSIVQFTDHIVAGRLTDYASTDSAVIAGVHVIRTEWTDVDGISRQITNEGSLDELWMKSSGGPKRDGTLHGVDVSASGQNSFVSTSADTYWGSLRFNLIQDGGGWYGRFGGTSGSAPIVVGAVALMLQMNPDLTAQQVREILRDTARDDSFTGSTPNADWGFGKLDVLAALDRVAQPVPTVSEWGVLVMGLLTATGGTLVLRSRYRGTAEFSST